MACISAMFVEGTGRRTANCANRGESIFFFSEDVLIRNPLLIEQQKQHETTKGTRDVGLLGYV